MMPKHQYSMLENIIFLLTLSYKEQKCLNRGMARVLLVLINTQLLIKTVSLSLQKAMLYICKCNWP